MTVKTMFLIFLIHVTSGELLYDFNTCQNWTYKPRPDLDNWISKGAMIAEISDVSGRVECFSQCLWRGACNLVLYNVAMSKCRLYHEAFHVTADAMPEFGWQYFGVPCSDYRLDNMAPTADVLTSSPAQMCDVGYEMTSNCDVITSSCSSGSAWEQIEFWCVSSDTYFGTLYNIMNIGDPLDPDVYYENLSFNLVPGMKLKLEVSGDEEAYNQVSLENGQGDMMYMVSLRWAYDYVLYGEVNTVESHTIFNTRVSGWWDTEEIVDILPVNNRSDFIIEIHILDTQFVTYTDGNHVMTNDMRHSFTGVSTVGLSGLLSVSQFQIGYNLC